MCLTIAEGRAMVNAARKLGRVTQVGTQQRSMPINNRASDLVKNGALGKIRVVEAANFVGPFRWTKTSSADVTEPVESWWDTWTLPFPGRRGKFSPLYTKGTVPFSRRKQWIIGQERPLCRENWDSPP